MAHRFGPILCTLINCQEQLNPMVFMKHMLLVFRKVQKRCNRSYGIQITASFRANFMHPGQFLGTARPDGFRETHVLGVPKSPEALQSELRNLDDGSIFGRFRRL